MRENVTTGGTRSVSEEIEANEGKSVLQLLWEDKFALGIFVTLILICAVCGSLPFFFDI